MLNILVFKDRRPAKLPAMIKLNALVSKHHEDGNTSIPNC